MPQEPVTSSSTSTGSSSSGKAAAVEVSQGQKRRPSTIAEQAMRKLGLTSIGPLSGVERRHCPNPQTSMEMDQFPTTQRSNSFSRGSQHPPPFRESISSVSPQAIVPSSQSQSVTAPGLYQLGPESAEVISSSDLTPGYSKLQFSSDIATYSMPRYTNPSIGSFSGGVSTYTRPDSVIPQYSSSTDEGVETDMEDNIPSSHRSQQRLSYASSSSSSGVGVHNKSLSQHLSSDSSCSSSHVSSLQSNFSTFETSLDYQFDQFESDLASSLPSCTSPGINKPSISENIVISTSAIHPFVYVTSNKSWSRHSPIAHNQSTGGHFTHRNITRSPVDFREGRRASDGLVAQHGGVVTGADNHQVNSQQTGNIAFNSQKLNETTKAKGVMELHLHLVQREHQALQSLYQSSVPQEEMAQRQLQHSEYRNQDQSRSKRVENLPYPPLDQAPLQQMMQHRMLQQKRQGFQKQSTAFNQPTASVDNSPSNLSLLLSRRQMLRQASYKLAQQQQIVPPLPHPDTIIEDSSNGAISSPRQLPIPPGDPLQSLLESSQENWQTLQNSMASCQISEPSPQPPLWSGGQTTVNLGDSLLVSSVPCTWQPVQATSWSQHQVAHK